jgi:hypothetical protein
MITYTIYCCFVLVRQCLTTLLTGINVLLILWRFVLIVKHRNSCFQYHLYRRCQKTFLSCSGLLKVFCTLRYVLDKVCYNFSLACWSSYLSRCNFYFILYFKCCMLGTDAHFVPFNMFFTCTYFLTSMWLPF